MTTNVKTFPAALEITKRLEKIIAKQERIIAKQAKEIIALKKEIKELQRKNRDLWELVQKEGHPRISRPMPDKIDEVREAKLAKCPDCGRRVSIIGARERIIEDIDAEKLRELLKAMTLIIDVGYCRCCKKKVEAPVIEAFPGCRFGINIYLYNVYLRRKVGLSYGQIKFTSKYLGSKFQGQNFT